MQVRLIVCSLVAAMMVCGGGAMAVINAPAPKTIKEVMKIAHKDGLMKKVAGGSASDEEKKQLLDLYIDLLEGEPKKGDKAEWKTIAGATVVSAAKVVLGREGATDELKKTTDCMACHSKFK
jgi:surface antigen